MIRVIIRNFGGQAVQLTDGTLYVLVESRSATRGENSSAWTVIQTSTEKFNATDRIFGMVSSRVPSDMFQATVQTYLQIERWA